ncbi:MAG: T9SS type A sorting domain-containing protein, partial [Calditrichaeota bacterium]|nr:T9SS type A sorting domain-containing protein [Calditrichota bacterium]
ARWAATGGTIDRRGLYSAGSDTGFYYVTAEDSLSGITGAAVVWISTITKIDAEKNAKPPTRFTLFQNYPNPFNPETTIRFDVVKSCHVQLTLYDLQGRVVKKLVDGEFSPGRYKVKIRATHLSSGLYLYSIKMGDFHAVRKMLILK